MFEYYFVALYPERDSDAFIQVIKQKADKVPPVAVSVSSYKAILCSGEG